jgi:hypothetical protein
LYFYTILEPADRGLWYSTWGHTIEKGVMSYLNNHIDGLSYELVLNTGKLDNTNIIIR